MPGELLTIGELAQRSGRRASTIRYYEQIGLLPEPVRISGQRRYPEAAVRTLAVIAASQHAGLSLDEIRPLIEFVAGDGTAAVHQLRQVAGRKLPQQIALIERAELVHQWLEAAASCECPSLDDCSLFDEAAIPAEATATGSIAVTADMSLKL